MNCGVFVLLCATVLVVKASVVVRCVAASWVACTKQRVGCVAVAYQTVPAPRILQVQILCKLQKYFK